MITDLLTVLVVDDRKLAKAGLRAILDRAPRVHVIAEAASHREAVNCQRRCRPDVVVIDSLARAIDAQALVTIFADNADGIPVNILVLVDGMNETAWNIFRSGARGVLLKQCRAHELIAALELVATGYVVLAAPRPPDVDRFAGHSSNGTTIGPSSLTAREIQVLGLIGRGFSNARISHNLRIQETTVKTHVRSLLDKLALQNRVQAAIYAHRAGLVPNGTEPAE
jgi:DNA-binding NarL/FixJ family response regulator